MGTVRSKMKRVPARSKINEINYDSVWLCVDRVHTTSLVCIICMREGLNWVQHTESHSTMHTFSATGKNPLYYAYLSTTRVHATCSTSSSMDIMYIMHTRSYKTSTTLECVHTMHRVVWILRVVVWKIICIPTVVCIQYDNTVAVCSFSVCHMDTARRVHMHTS